MTLKHWSALLRGRQCLEGEINIKWPKERQEETPDGENENETDNGINNVRRHVPCVRK